MYAASGQHTTIYDAQRRAVTDLAFRERLCAAPAAALAEAGVRLPAGTVVDVHEATDERVPFLIPPPATADESVALARRAVRLRAAADPAFRERLLADPAAVLVESGIPLPAGTEIVLVQTGAGRLDLVLPPAEDTASWIRRSMGPYPRPRSSAAASSWREAIPSLRYALLRCVSTVLRERKSA